MSSRQTITINDKVIDITDAMRALDVMIVNGAARELECSPAVARAAMYRAGVLS